MGRPQTEETKRKIRETLQHSPLEIRTCQCGITFEVHQKTTKRFCSQKCASQKKSKKHIETLFELSARTVKKIFKRMNVGCSRCGWNEGTCDLHHIYGRKIPDPHNHQNLSCLCPNHHRMVHEKKIPIDEIVSLAIQIGDSWKQFYYR